MLQDTTQVPSDFMAFIHEYKTPLIVSGVGIGALVAMKLHSKSKKKKPKLGDDFGKKKSTEYTEVGEITPELATLINRPAGKIFISKAVVNHIRNRHGQQIHKYKDSAIIEYVKDALCNINEVREGDNEALILIHRQETTADLVIVEECVLEFVNGVYRVKTAYKGSLTKLKNKKLIVCGKDTKL